MRNAQPEDGSTVNMFSEKKWHEEGKKESS
jgi:hypothetical protein